MTVKWTAAQQLDIDTEVEKIIASYAESDRENFTNELLQVLRSSAIVKLLDETSAFGPGTLRDVLRVCIKIGKIDASLAWVVGVSNSAWSMRSNFQLFDSQILVMEYNKIFGMVLGKPGVLIEDKISNKYFLSGEWKYASGYPYCSFFFCLACLGNTHTKEVRVIAVPSELLEISAKWNATGLRGTQSVTVIAENIEIPHNNITDYSHILSKGSRVLNNASCNEGAASYSGLFTGVLMNCLLGSMLGATEAALEYVESIADKHPVAGSTYALMADSGAIRAEIGRLRSTLDLYLRAAEYNADVIDNAAYNPATVLTMQERVENRGRAALIMRGCVNIVQDLLWIYGSSGLNRGTPLERIWRDVNVGALHAGFSKLVPEEAVGLAFIGRNPKDLTRMF